MVEGHASPHRVGNKVGHDDQGVVADGLRTRAMGKAVKDNLINLVVGHLKNNNKIINIGLP
jgi:hypothetical protein